MKLTDIRFFALLCLLALASCASMSDRQKAEQLAIEARTDLVVAERAFDQASAEQCESQSLVTGLELALGKTPSCPVPVSRQMARRGVIVVAGPPLPQNPTQADLDSALARLDTANKQVDKAREDLERAQYEVNYRERAAAGAEKRANRTKARQRDWDPRVRTNWRF